MPPRKVADLKSGSTRLASVCASTGWPARADSFAATGAFPAGWVVSALCACATPAMQTISIARTSVRVIHDFIGPPKNFVCGDSRDPRGLGKGADCNIVTPRVRVQGNGFTRRARRGGEKRLSPPLRVLRVNHSPYHHPMNWLIKNFLRGLVIVVPIALTLYLLYEAFVRIDRLLNLPTPGAGFAIMIVAIIAIGAVASNFFVRKDLRMTESLFSRAPLVRLIYAAITDLPDAFVGDKKRFDQPVSVKLTDEVRTFGFVTQDDLAFLDLGGHVAVYLPFS